MEAAGPMYREGRQRLTDLVAPLGDAGASTEVPACPGWAVHDVIAHLAGACTDSLAGRLDGATTAAWAESHVASRRHQPLGDLLDEWEASASALEEVIDGAVPPRLATLWVLDLTVHEHDVRGALQKPGARDSTALAMAVDFLVRQGLHPTLRARGTGPLDVRTPEQSWVVGGPDPAEAPAEPAPAAVTLPRFELFRALTGRRSRDQITRFDWTVDPAPFVAGFQFGTFTTRTADLPE